VPVGSWEALGSFLAALPEEDRARFSRYAAIDLPEGPEALFATLRAYAAENPAATASGLLATTGAQASSSGDLDLARSLGAAALELAETREERELAHVCLARTHFQNRREEEHLLAFEEHCRAAIDLGHAGTFCYERLAVLYEYRGDLEEAAKVCRRAVEALEGAGDLRSAGRFRRRLQRLLEKGLLDD
jgi:tetratricopeptide (TPR) repeat protein